MSPIKPSHSINAQPQQPQRRQLLATAATLGVAPWLLSACASAANTPAVAPKAAGSRRKIGPSLQKGDRHVVRAQQLAQQHG